MVMEAQSPRLNVRVVLLATVVSLPAWGHGTGPADVTHQVTHEAEAHLRSCPTDLTVERARFCEQERREFVRDYLRARAGETQAQRNVALVLSGSVRDGPWVPNWIEACAWRVVVVAGDHGEAGEFDDRYLRIACGRLDEQQRAEAHTKAQHLQLLILGNVVPEPPSRRVPGGHTGPMSETGIPAPAGVPQRQ
jgi:hypothetical protein